MSRLLKAITSNCTGSQVNSIELLSMIMKLPDSIKTERTELDAGEWESVKNTLKEALDKLNTFRDQEGDSLERDIRLRIDAIRQKLDHVDITFQ